jgi:hypothetical protein
MPYFYKKERSTELMYEARSGFFSEPRYPRLTDFPDYKQQYANVGAGFARPAIMCATMRQHSQIGRIQYAHTFNIHAGQADPATMQHTHMYARAREIENLPLGKMMFASGPPSPAPRRRKMAASTILSTPPPPPPPLLRQTRLYQLCAKEG